MRPRQDCIFFSCVSNSMNWKFTDNLTNRGTHRVKSRHNSKLSCIFSPGIQMINPTIFQYLYVMPHCQRPLNAYKSTSPVSWCILWHQPMYPSVTPHINQNQCKANTHNIYIMKQRYYHKMYCGTTIKLNVLLGGHGRVLLTWKSVPHRKCISISSSR